MVDGGRSHDADDGVAAGHGVVVEEEDRLAVGGHLDRAAHHAFARQLGVAQLGTALQRLALEADPLAVAA